MCVSGRERRRLQRRLPRRQRLPRQAVHQVDADVCKPRRLRHAHGFHGLPRRVDAANVLQQARVEALHADGQPVNAHLPVGAQFLHRQRAGVGFQGHLRPRRETKRLPRRRQRSGDVCFRHQRGRAAAEKHRLHAVYIVARGAYLPAKRGKVRLPHRLPPREGGKIAVGALGLAERYVDVEGKGRGAAHASSRSHVRPVFFCMNRSNSPASPPVMLALSSGAPMEGAVKST